MRIRLYRLKLGWTLDELSRRSGISRVSLTRYELGERVPNVTIVLKICKALGCTVEELYGTSSDEGGEQRDAG